MASTKITCMNETDIPADFVITWALTLIGITTVHPEQLGTVGTEFVWYDVWVKASGSNTELAGKRGVYGNSTVVLKKTDRGYELI